MTSHRYTNTSSPHAPTGSCSFFIVILTTVCLSARRSRPLSVPLPYCYSSYYFDNDVGCVPSPLALDETSYEAGIKVQLHTQSEPPFLHELGFGVAPGFQTFVSTQVQRVAYDCLGLLHATDNVLSNSYTPMITFHTFICLPPPSLPEEWIHLFLCAAEATTCNSICSLSVSPLSSLFKH